MLSRWIRPRRRGGVLALAVLAVAALSVGGLVSDTSLPTSDLDALERDIASTYTHVVHLETDKVATEMAQNRENVALFDVRAPAEFAVSRLPGSIRVDPAIPAREFISRYGAGLTGKRVVFYCSVGVRSSKLAGRLTNHLQALDVQAVNNMRGGLFRWHNERRDLVDAGGAVDVVHPYDDYWKRYLAEPQKARQAVPGTQ